jgi:hypothetical protein
MTFGQTGGKCVDIILKMGNLQKTPLSKRGKDFNALRTQNLNDPEHLKGHEMTLKKEPNPQIVLLCLLSLRRKCGKI